MSAQRKIHASRAAIVDFDCRAIRVGDTVTIVTSDWTVGAASWMKDARATVTALGRRRVHVRFAERQATASLPGHVVRVLRAG